jgi:hypothetical protein
MKTRRSYESSLNLTEYYIPGYRRRILHRLDGPALKYDGSMLWYRYGELHRVDGPAIIYSNGTKCWYLNGVRHREYGPSVVSLNGWEEWHLNGERYTKEEWFDLLNDEQKEKMLYSEHFIGG